MQTGAGVGRIPDSNDLFFLIIVYLPDYLKFNFRYTMYNVPTPTPSSVLTSLHQCPHLPCHSQVYFLDRHNFKLGYYNLNLMLLVL